MVDKYEVLGKYTGGAFSTIYKARNVRNDEMVIIKTEEVIAR